MKSAAGHVIAENRRRRRLPLAEYPKRLFYGDPARGGIKQGRNVATREQQSFSHETNNTDESLNDSIVIFHKPGLH
jgi:hypothetical protein